MNTLKSLTLTILLMLSAFICYARKFAVDSIDAITKEHVRIAELNIGNHDYYKYGKLMIEQRRNKYSITFPYFVYTDPPRISEEDTIPKWTPIVLQLNNGKIVKSQTVEDIIYEWHYVWHYSTYTTSNHLPERTYESMGADIDRYKGYLPGWGTDSNDLYGTCWQIKTDFTPADMLQLRTHRIVSAYIICKGRNQYLPIKHKQSKRSKN